MSQNLFENLNNEESTFIEKAKKIFKQLIFNVFSPLLISESNFSLPFKILFFLVETIQVLYFCFKPQISYLWEKVDWSNKIKRGFGYFMIVPYFNSATYNSYIIFLYILSVLFFWILMSSCYIGYNFTQKSKSKYSKGFLIGFVKYFNELLPQVLFLPIFDFFFSYFRCVKNDQDVLVNEIFPDVVCYQGDYIFHSFIAAFAFGTFFFYSILNITCFYEIINKTYGAKITGVFDFYFLLFKVLLEISFSFLQTSQNIILLGIFSFGSMVLFELYNKSFIYYNDFIMRMAITQHSIFAWTGMMLVFCKITFDLPNDSYLYIWIVGISAILIISFGRIRIKFNYLILDTEAFAKEEEALDVLDYLTFSLDYYKKDKTIAISLDGFIEYHKTYCVSPSCPSRKEYNTKSVKNATIADNDNENILLLSHLICVIFYKTLQRFPNSIKIRLRYAIFLLDRMGQKQNALQELLTTGSYKLKLDEEFLIFRLKNIIEKDIFEENYSNQRLQFNELFLRDLIKSIQENIEKSSNYNMEFWNLLSEDCPNLTKLKEIGSKMSALYKIIERNQKILQSMNVFIPKIELLYSKYLLIIVQNKEESTKIFDKIQESHPQNRILTVYFSEYFNDSSPIIIISADDKNLGYITHVSLSLSATLGYSRSELIGRKVNILMTQIYGNHHDKFVEDYITTLEPRILNKDIEIPIKTKANYIKKATLVVKIYNTVLQGPQFLGIFTFEKTVKQFSYMVCDEKGTILDFSSSCIPLLGIDRKKILKQKLQINDIIPDFFNNLKELKTKQGMNLHINIQEKADIKNDEEKSLTRISSMNHMNVNVVCDIKFRHSDLLGYFIRIEPKHHNFRNAEKHEEKLKSEVFNMQFDPKSKSYIGNLCEEKDFDRILNSNNPVQDLDLINSAVANEETKHSENIIEKSHIADDIKEMDLRKEYSFGIKTLRLVKNKLYDLEELKKEENEEEGIENEEDEVDEMELSPLKMQKVNEGDDPDDFEKDEDSDARYKSLNNFKAYLNNKKSKKFEHLTNLKYVGLILVLSLTILSIVGYFIINQSLDSVIVEHDFIFLSNQRISEVMTILNSINQMVLLNEKWILSNIYNEFNLRAILNSSIYELSNIQYQLQSSNAACPDLNANKIYVKFQTGNGTFDIDQITSQIISKSYSLLTNTTFEEFTPENADIVFIRDNSLSEYHFALMQLSNSCINHMSDSIQHSTNLSIVFLVISTLTILFLWIFILYIIFLGILKFEQETLKIFLCLPLEKVKVLLKKSEEFHSQFKIGELEQNEENESSENKYTFDNDDEEEKAFKVKISKKKRKKYRMETGKYKFLFLYTFILMMSLEAYFIGAYTITNNFSIKLQNGIGEYNATSTMIPFYSFYNNVIREIILDKNFKTINEGNLTNDFMMEKISEFYNYFYTIQEQHEKNNDLSSAYNSSFSQIFASDSCDYITSNPLNLNCSDYSNGILTQGLIIVLPNFFENERYIISLWNYFTNSSNNSLEFLNISSLVYPFGSDNVRNNLINLLKLDVMETSNVLQENFVKTAFKFILSEFKQELSADDDSTNLQSLTLIICFLVFLFSFYGFFWIPFMSSLKHDHVRTTNLLLMIPLKLIRNSALVMESIEENLK